MIRVWMYAEMRCKILGHFITNGTNIFYGKMAKSTENLLFENIYALHPFYIYVIYKILMLIFFSFISSHTFLGGLMSSFWSKVKRIYWHWILRKAYRKYMSLILFQWKIIKKKFANLLFLLPSRPVLTTPNIKKNYIRLEFYVCRVQTNL